MTNAASRYFGLMLLITTVATAWSQSSPVTDAINESVRRQHTMGLLRQKLIEADDAAARRDLASASRRYEEAYNYVEQIGSGYGIEADAQRARQGLVSVRLELARQAAKRNDLPEVKTQTDRVLMVDPQNSAALQMRAQNQKLMAETVSPTQAAIEAKNESITNQHDAKVLARNAAVYLEAGKLVEAERELKEAARIAPDEPAVMHYQNLLRERQYRDASRKADMDSRASVVQVEEAWNKPTTRDLLPIPNQYATNNLIYTGKGRQGIMAKLDRIRLDSIAWTDTGLAQVINDLSTEARKRDPGGKGINILLNPNADFAAVAGPPVIDPNTGLPIPTAAAEAVDIGTVGITINPPLNDLRLADALDAVVKVAKTPIKYSVEDYTIVFSLRGPETPVLYIRTFTVDPNTFYQGLEAVSAFSVADIQNTGGSGGGGGGGGQNNQPLTVPRVSVAGGGPTGTGGGGGGGGNQQGGLRSITVTNNMASVSVAVQNYFTTLGVDLASPAAQAAGKSVFWNDRAGQLLVRATAQDLDLIEAAIQLLNKVPHQINIRTKFVEVNQEDNRAFGVDWYIGNFWVGGKDIIGSAGTQPTLNGAPSLGNPAGTFPGSASPGNALIPGWNTTIPPASSDGLLSSSLRNVYGADGGSIPTLASFTGILTDPQFRVVIRALDQRKGVDLLASPEVTTVSGRQAQVQVQDLQYIVTGVDQNTGGQNTTPTTSTGGGTVNQAPQAVFQTPQTQLLPFGPTMDVIPYISADGYTIQMTIIPSYTEFVGYDDPGPFVPTAITGLGLSSTAVLPLPHFRLRQVTTSAVVWDGQTMVLGGLLGSSITRYKDKIPILGDLPFVGKAFRSESTQTRKKNLVIFVTPTILDPAGNRLHTEEEMPFAQNSIPPQAIGVSSGR